MVKLNKLKLIYVYNISYIIINIINYEILN